MRDIYMGSEMGVSLPIIDSADTDRNVWSAQKVKNELDLKADKEVVNSSQGRNLIPYPYYMRSGSVNNGITYTVNNDGSITANGTASADNDSFFNMTSRISSNWYLEAGKYTLSGNPSQDNNKIRLIIGGNSSTGTGENIAIDYGKGVTFEITEESAQRTKQVLLMIVRGETVENLTFYPQLEEGTIAHAYEPTIESNVSLAKASTFPSGDKFYLDEKDGVKGYNTSPTRGADTFHPFNSGISIIEQTFEKSGEYTIDTPSKAKKIIWFSTASGYVQVIYDENIYTNKYFYGNALTYGVSDIESGKFIEAVNDNSVVIKTNQANVKCIILY